MSDTNEHYEDEYFEDLWIENTTNAREKDEEEARIEDEYVSVDYNYLFRTDRTFPTRDDAREWIDDVSFDNNMAFYIASSVPGKTILRCERAGNPRKNKIVEESTSSSRKSSGSKKRGCRFRILLKQREENAWIVEVTDGLGFHNHPNGYYRQGHTIHARFKQPEIEKVKMSLDKGIQLKTIMKETKEAFPKNVTTSRGFQNLFAKLRRENMGGKSQMEVLVDLMTEHKYLYKMEPKAGTNKLGCLVFAPPETLNLIRLNPGVIIMDATYRTNQANLPLVEIIGIVSTGKNFHLAFAFIHNERTESYLFVMQFVKSLFELCNAQGPRVIVTDRELASIKALHEVFSAAGHLLCRRHIKMDCQGYLKSSEHTSRYEKTFRMRWDAVVFAPTEEDYDNAVAALKHSFRRHPAFLIYLDNTWLIPYRDRFVSAFTRKYMHYGTETTNRVESAHFQYKKFLGVVNSNLVTCFKKITEVVTFQHDEIKKEFEFSRTVKHPHCNLYLFHRLANKVSRKALEIMHDELAKCENSGDCTCELRDTHGLPCACEMMHLARTSQPITVDSIDIFWRTLHMENDKKIDINKDDAREIFKDTCLLYAEKANEMELMMQSSLLYHQMHPEICDIEGPDIVKPKGRPKNAVGSRIPCTWERREKELNDKTRQGNARTEKIPTEDGNSSANEKQTEEEIPKRKDKKSKKQNPRRPTNRNFNKYVYPLIDIFAKFVDEFLEDWVEVDADGNCGYRALAYFIYGSQAHHATVRYDAYNELISNPIYQRLIEDMYSIFQRVLLDVQTDTVWLNFTTCGLALATKYQVIINVHSLYGSTSYWPLKWRGRPEYPPREINIGHVRCQPKNPQARRNHFIALEVKEGAPMPPHACGFDFSREPIFERWRVHFAARQQQWEEMKEEMLAEIRRSTRPEYINLSDIDD